MNISYFFDTYALGYCTARHIKIKFLTGDEKFKGLLNVEMVK